MVIAFLVALNASALCVARTDVCAPAGSTVEGTVGPTGGHVTITPAKPMRALGAELAAGKRVLVDVTPWSSSDRTSGAVVQVAGELTHENVISGARVSGMVRIAQVQGRPGKPQLVGGALLGGTLAIGAAGTVDVTPGMVLAGSLDAADLRIGLTASQPIHALGLDLQGDRLQIDVRDTGTEVSGTLTHPQEIAGLLLDKQVWITLNAQHGTLRYGTVLRATPLAALGLPTGQAPAGTLVITDATGTRLVGPGPVTVCGVSLLPVATASQPAVTIARTAATTVQVNGGLSARDSDLGGGVFMSGPISASYDTASCRLVGISGTLSRASEQVKLHFAARAGFLISEVGKDRFIRGTFTAPQLVDGMTVTGETMVRVTQAGDVHLASGTLAKPARFEDWQLAEGSQVQRFEPGGGWSFTAPRGKPARAVADHHGERIDFVTEARIDGNQTSFMLARPHTVKGTTLAFDNLGIDHASGCVLGGAATRQTFGIFTIPPTGSATVCGGAVTAAQGAYAVPSLKVGSWFATEAIAGTLGSPPPRAPADDGLGRAPPTPPRGPPTSSKSRGASTTPGYWIQINSLCQGAAGIPLPPPPQRWIWVDAKGQTTNAADHKELAARASKPGAPCPVTVCCPP